MLSLFSPKFQNLIFFLLLMVDEKEHERERKKYDQQFTRVAIADRHIRLINCLFTVFDGSPQHHNAFPTHQQARMTSDP